MTKESNQNPKVNNTLAKFMLALMVFGISAVGILTYNDFQAEAFCQAKGHNTGRYKAIDGGYYSCMDFKKYNIQDINDGET